MSQRKEGDQSYIRETPYVRQTATLKCEHVEMTAKVTSYTTENCQFSTEKHRPKKMTA